MVRLIARGLRSEQLTPVEEGPRNQKKAGGDPRRENARRVPPDRRNRDDDQRRSSFGAVSNLWQVGASAPKEECHDEKDDTDNQKNLGKVRRKTCDAAETQQSRNQRDNGEGDGPSEHSHLSFFLARIPLPRARTPEQRSSLPKQSFVLDVL
ncbi:MAG: hypothetical protein ACTHJU_09530 [Sphingopyxis sp.]